MTTGAIRCAKLQSNRHHRQQTNTQSFASQMPFLSPSEQCQSTEGKTAKPTVLLKSSAACSVAPNVASDTNAMPLWPFLTLVS